MDFAHPDATLEEIRDGKSAHTGRFDALDRRELLVAHRRAADVDALRPRRCARGAPGSRRARLHRHALVLLLARFRPGARDASTSRFSTGSATSWTRMSELGLETIPTFIVGHMSGENWDPPWRHGRDLYRDVWLVAQQAWFVREIARRFHRHAVAGWLLSNEMPIYGGRASIAGDHRLGPHPHAGRAGRRRDAADLDRRRRLGRRGLRRGQRLFAESPRAARRFLRPPLVPDAGRSRASVPHARVRLRARRQPRQAGRARGVRSQLGLRRRRPCGRLLPAGPPHVAPRRSAWLARVEQHGLRRPSAPGSVSPPRVRAALRPDRYARSAEATAPRARRVRRAHPQPLSRRVGAGGGRGRTPGAGALRAGAAVHRAGLPARPPRQPAPGVRRRTRGRPPGRARARARRHSRQRAALSRPLREAADRLRGSTGSASSPRAAPRSTPRTSPAAPRPSVAPGSPGWTRSSASATGCATASSTRSRTTRSSSSSSTTSATSRRALD